MRPDIRFSKGGLVIAYHNEIHNKIIQRTRQAFYPYCVCGELFIQQVHSISWGGVLHLRIIPETQGNVLIRVLWEIQTDSIIDVKFGDADAETYVKKGMDTLLPRWE